MTQATNPPDPTLADLLARLDHLATNVDHLAINVETSRTELKTEIESSRSELKAEVKRWDERFFKFSEDTANRSLTLIAGASISVIAGVILLLLREGSR